MKATETSLRRGVHRDDAGEIEDLEITLLLEALLKRYGHDFTQYARASIARRIRSFLERSGSTTVSGMIPLLLRDESLFERFLKGCSIPVTEMFRDPFVYRSLREQVAPVLKTYPFIRVWLAGCATGEEVYSLAILLREESLYDRSTVFATDFNDAVLATARDGVYSLKEATQYTRNYQQAGGTRPFAEYYHAEYDRMAMQTELRENVTFANHNLVTDGVFGEMHLILCRNVLIYFDRDLQTRVLNLFSDSLVNSGFLCLGTKESVQFTAARDQLIPFDEKARIYRKRSP